MVKLLVIYVIITVFKQIIFAKSGPYYLYSHISRPEQDTMTVTCL